jgi:hypothetical protein
MDRFLPFDIVVICSCYNILMLLDDVVASRLSFEKVVSYSCIISCFAISRSLVSDQTISP